MIGAETFGLAEKRLRTAHNNDDDWFGGANIILFGHHAQVSAPSVCRSLFFALIF
jgi:hypothetical protein